MKDKKKQIYLISTIVAAVVVLIILITTLAVVLKPKTNKPIKQNGTTYKIQHIFQGLAGEIEEKIVEETKGAEVGAKVQITQDSRKKEYDNGFEVADFAEVKKIEANGSTVFQIRYGRKLFEVNFEVNFNNSTFPGTTSTTPETQRIKFEAKAQKPADPEITANGKKYRFIHWQEKSQMNGVYSKQTPFDFSKPITKNITLVAYFEELFSISYQIELEKPNGEFEEKTETKRWFQAGEVHTVNFQNPDERVYGEVVYDKNSLTVSPNSSQNKVKITVKRKLHAVTFQVLGANLTLPKKLVRHEDRIWEIDVTDIYREGYYIQNIQKDARNYTLTRLQSEFVTQDIIAIFYLAKDIVGKGKYPQSLVYPDPSKLTLMENSIRRTQYKIGTKTHKITFNRYFYRDQDGNKYEKFDGNFYKFEDVEFVTIPGTKSKFTKKIIDFAPYTFILRENAKSTTFENSFLSSLTKDIALVLGFEVGIPSYNDADKYSVKSVLNANNFAALAKIATDYATAVYVSSEYRQHDDYIDTQLPYGVRGIDKIISSGSQTWWLTTLVVNESTKSYYIDKAGMLAQERQNYLFGLVVCKDWNNHLTFKSVSSLYTWRTFYFVLNLFCI